MVDQWTETSTSALGLNTLIATDVVSEKHEAGGVVFVSFLQRQDKEYMCSPFFFRIFSRVI